MKLSNELIKFNNHSKQVAVSLKIYGNFQSVLTIRVQKINKDDKFPILKNIKSIFFAILLIKSCALMIDLTNQLFFTEEKCSQ